MKSFTFLLLLLPLGAWSQTLQNIDFGRKDTFQYFSVIDTAYSRYRLPNVFTKPKPWQETDTKLQKGEFYGNAYPADFTLQDALRVIDEEKEFARLCSAKSWCLRNYSEVFPYLLTRLSIKQKIGLTNTADLIIWDRIMTGDLKFYGHGGGMNEDLFTVAGRASWILNCITGEHFAEVHGNLTHEEAQRFKNLWIDYLQALK